MTPQDYEALQARLRSLADPAYQACQQKLVPDVPNLLGVRVPALRQLARELAQRRDTHAEQVWHIRHQFLLTRLIGRIRQRSEARLQGLVILWSHRLFLSFGAVRS